MRVGGLRQVVPRPDYHDWTLNQWVDEVVTQLWQQPLHFLWAGATLIAPFLPVALFTGTLRLLAFATLSLASVVSAGVLVARELDQGESRRPWDPWIDRVFFLSGALVGISAGIWLVVEFS